jgi:endonuclease/exonuclease/phosphatase family metal-dependent hydrolase
LLSYNIHKGIGGRDRRYRLPRIIDVIEAENPDLICLQEVTRDAPRFKHEDQPQLLADYFRLEGLLFQQNVHFRRGGYGNLLLSRWPMIEKHQISLRHNTRKPRGAQVAVVETPEGPLHLVNVHLGLNEKERHWQVRHLLEHRLFRQGVELPTIIIGDCNDWRNTLGRGVFAQFGLTEITHPRSRFRTFPAWMPVGALDKAFCCGELDIRAARVVRNQAAKDASDHLPLVVDFHLRETP